MTPQKPSNTANLAADPPSATVLRDMSARLTARLKAAGDQREVTGQAPWDGWEYHGRKARETHPERKESKPNQEGKNNGLRVVHSFQIGNGSTVAVILSPFLIRSE